MSCFVFTGRLLERRSMFMRMPLAIV